MLGNVQIYQIQACFAVVNIRYTFLLPYEQFYKQYNHLLACLHVAREVQIHDMHIFVFFSLFFFKDYESHAVLAVKLNFKFLRTLDAKAFKHKYASSLVVPIQSVPPAAIVSYSGVDVTLIFSLETVSSLNDVK